MEPINLFDCARLYGELCVLLALGYFCFWLTARAAIHGQILSTSVLPLGRILLGISLVLPLLAATLPNDAFLRPSIQVWSGVGRSAQIEATWLPANSTEVWGSMIPAGYESMKIPSGILSGVLAMVLVGMFIAFFRLWRSQLKLRGFLGSLPSIKTLGRVSVLTTDDEGSPFSARCSGRAYVVIPSRFWLDPVALKIAVRHEIQHHRQGDLRWLHLITCLKAFFFLNPVIYAWERLLNEVQELACDETLIGRRKVSPFVYGRCLLRTAESVVRSRSPLAGTTGMATSAAGHILKRRIEMLLTQKKKPIKRWGVALIGCSALALLTTVAFAARSLIQDRTVTLDEAQGMAVPASIESAIPIEVNELVLAKLNRFVGTPEGRKFVRAGLARMPAYRAMIEQKIALYRFPPELLAIPLFESGFRNEAISPPPYLARGIWQFIPETARRYGLVVDETQDQRLAADIETDGAMRLYSDLLEVFRDWRLALIAYNAGESRVNTLIREYHTRDPWELERRDPKAGYLSGAMAMMIILKNPSLLD